MTAEIHQFPEVARLKNRQVLQHQAERKELADWFRALANHIEGNELEYPPLAALIVLSSAAGDEVVTNGYSKNGIPRSQAGSNAYRFATATYSRRGGNFYDRQK
ncbi:hypothetical protein ACFQDN_21680 [Pseudomonas asuensis]|uniref:PH domain-containing protein n=1 Tax=Pseudomonas asuensis TaxID=1825787 RepID=A0ABQ2H2M4_9PSED|nr:hypothetical protein [Pseudomonas asuensis]GGM25030.1 hypothetical protein GCM10009425_39800 [Pseudomonas asuensis]